MSSKCEQAVSFYAHLREAIAVAKGERPAPVRATVDEGKYTETWTTHDGWTQTWEGFGHAVKVTDPRGNKYDVDLFLGNVVRVTDADGNPYTFIGG